jgi:hypothetical protein
LAGVPGIPGMSETVVLVEGVPDGDDQTRIRGVPGAKVEFFSEHDILEGHVGEANVLAGRLSPGAFNRAERLKWCRAGLPARMTRCTPRWCPAPSC